MRLNCVSSGSNANCYFLTADNGEILILDCGVTVDRLMKNRNFTCFRKVVGALISHEHKDHSLSRYNLELSGVQIAGYMNLQPKKRYHFGCFDVIPFYVQHDVKNYGFIISERGKRERFVYATDCATLPQVAGVDHWLIECNYCESRWNENLMAEDAKIGYLGRVKFSHMALETLEEYFRLLPQRAKTIILCHLSENGNADKEMMLNRMQPFADKVDVATKNKEWRL